ncbi:SRPBCC family protein [Verrucomicrobia bacterium]|nr:SRPBCC family protein [Verrucomicrobiota bacterium]
MSPEAILILTPPWQPMEVIEYSELAENSLAVFRTRILGIPFYWEAEHFDVQLNKQFCDRQVKGPFRKWIHRHLFLAKGNETCLMIDEIDFTLTRARWINRILGNVIYRKIDALFEFRHQVLLQQFGERKKKTGSLSQDAGNKLVRQSTGTAP